MNLKVGVEMIGTGTTVYVLAFMPGMVVLAVSRQKVVEATITIGIQ
jgi:hypothetical protein